MLQRKPNPEHRPRLEPVPLKGMSGPMFKLFRTLCQCLEHLAACGEISQGRAAEVAGLTASEWRSTLKALDADSRLFGEPTTQAPERWVPVAECGELGGNWYVGLFADRAFGVAGLFQGEWDSHFVDTPTHVLCRADGTPIVVSVPGGDE